ncbi:MAG TPA: isochorismatase family protein [Solirubrobacteraceae bacterium]|nr:isochorismatase family protein [Solirubrobacteraceae bacterium]
MTCPSSTAPSSSTRSACSSSSRPDRNGSTDERLLERLPADTPVFAKDTLSLVANDEAVEAIRAIGRTTTVVIGFETDTCVSQSAVQLHDLGFRVVVPQDAAYTTGDLEHRRGLEHMTRAGVEIHHCKGVAYEWLRTVDDAATTLKAAAERFGPPVAALRCAPSSPRRTSRSTA